MSNNKVIGYLVGVGLIATAGIAIYAQMRSDGPVGRSDRAYFSDDDGKTWFTDSVGKFPPFDHGGRPAYRAAVFIANGTKFVGYLQRFRPETIKVLNDAVGRANGSAPGRAALDVLLASREVQVVGSEIKLAGPGKPWIPASQFRESSITGPGGSPVEPVMP